MWSRSTLQGVKKLNRGNLNWKDILCNFTETSSKLHGNSVQTTQKTMRIEYLNALFSGNLSREYNVASCWAVMELAAYGFNHPYNYGDESNAPTSRLPSNVELRMFKTVISGTPSHWTLRPTLDVTYDPQFDVRCVDAQCTECAQCTKCTKVLKY